MNTKLFKKALFTGILTLLFAVTVSAQEAVKPEDGAKALTSYMKEKFTLNDSQYTKVFSVNLAFMQKTLENNNKTNKVEKLKKQRAIEEERDTKLKSVMSDDQYKLYIATKAQDRKKISEYYQ
ncbi:hypothetical protein ACLI1A_03590 [Flavobacterium sp. RHBU_3]|uniref:hypothetical protein n=1 Tax=Flavobacterium sp. RHBU_3 TaxID=3391184 RepID=UPI003984FCA1